LNGEDYYANPGEIQYLQTNHGRFQEIVLGINLDGCGYIEGNSAFSLYDCPPALAALTLETLSAQHGLVEGPPWYQGDHYLFIMNNIPALAVTSEYIFELMSSIVHTSEDRPEIISVTKLVNTAAALQKLLLKLNHHAGQLMQPE
jgi:aminopeptidase YwaD